MDHFENFLKRLERDPWIADRLRTVARSTLKEMGHGQQQRPKGHHGDTSEQAQTTFKACPKPFKYDDRSE